MRGPTRSASVMAATTSGWLMVWPKAMGSAVFSQARSAKAGVHEALAVDVADGGQDLFVGDARLPQLGDQALHGRDVHGRSRSVGLNRCGELRGKLAARRLVGEIEMQRRHRDVARAHGR